MSEAKWYDNDTNVLALTRWMCEVRGPDKKFIYADAAICSCIRAPEHYRETWGKYQASLKPKEPTLFEKWQDSYARWQDSEKNTECGIEGLHTMVCAIAQKVEALERKVGE